MKKYILVLSFLVFVFGLIAIPAFADVFSGGEDTTCISLQNNLKYRSRDIKTNDEVSILQDFLQAEGYFKPEPTGYFGLVTVSAVKAFQNANGLGADGSVGPITRAKIKAVSCDGVTTNPLTSITITSTSPLPNAKVGARYDFSPMASDGVHGGFIFAVSSGSFLPPGLVLSEGMSITGIPTVAGTYTFSLIASVTQFNYGSQYATKQFTLIVDPVNSTNTTPIIHGVSGPQSLKVNEQGTWTVTASDPSNSNLQYSVIWGDEVPNYNAGGYAGVSGAAFKQSATFTHSYSSARIYTPVFTVKNTNDYRAQTSLSVKVGDITITTISTPTITSITPTSGPIGTHIVINGYGFASNVAGTNGITLNFGSNDNGVSIINDNSIQNIQFIIPSVVTTCSGGVCNYSTPVTSGIYPISLTQYYDNGTTTWTKKTSNILNFTVTSTTTPQITSIVVPDPNPGSVNYQTLKIFGTNLAYNNNSTTTTLEFNGPNGYLSIPLLDGSSFNQYEPDHLSVGLRGDYFWKTGGIFTVNVITPTGTSNKMSFTLTPHMSL